MHLIPNLVACQHAAKTILIPNGLIHCDKIVFKALTCIILVIIRLRTLPGLRLQHTLSGSRTCCQPPEVQRMAFDILWNNKLFSAVTQRRSRGAVTLLSTWSNQLVVSCRSRRPVLTWLVEPRRSSYRRHLRTHRCSSWASTTPNTSQPLSTSSGHTRAML